jgi:hypothetical protein
MVERSLVAGRRGCRQVPYRRIERNDLWWSVRVAAVNLRRLLVLGLAHHDGAWVLALPALHHQGPITIPSCPPRSPRTS